MANERNPDDPYRTNVTDDELRRAQRIDNDLQMDPELAEGPASTGKIAMVAVAVAVVLGVVFFGLNHSTINEAGTSPTSSTAQNTPSSPPAAPSGMRDVTPRANNNDQGVTTGAAPARPATRRASNAGRMRGSHRTQRAACPPRSFCQPNILFNSPPA
jgi:hypothetical protein